MQAGISSRRSRGFAIVELVALSLGGVVGATLLLVIQPSQQERERAANLVDAKHLRTLQVAMDVFARSNKGAYPLPSTRDPMNTTVADKGRAKDTSANIVSMMIFDGFYTTETCISALERNPSIRNHTKYDLNKPSTAVDAMRASWDPSFSADFTRLGGGHLSFSHQQPSGDRLNRWKDTTGDSEAVFCARGVEMTGSVVQDENTATPSLANPKSNTLNMYEYYGTPGQWSGNVAFNDGHVEMFQNRFGPGRATVTGKQYADKNNKPLPDMAFYDEPDDPKSTNNFLGIFIKAGDTPAAFKAIWD